MPLFVFLYHFIHPFVIHMPHQKDEEQPKLSSHSLVKNTPYALYYHSSRRETYFILRNFCWGSIRKCGNTEDLTRTGHQEISLGTLIAILGQNEGLLVIHVADFGQSVMSQWYDSTVWSSTMSQCYESMVWVIGMTQWLWLWLWCIFGFFYTLD